MLSFEVAQSTVSKYMVRPWKPRSQGWKTFLRNHAEAIAAIDMCVVPTLTFERLFAYGIAERFIGTLRRECLDQMLIFSEAHLRRVLSTYAAHYNQVRTHLALQKDAPLKRPIQRFGRIAAIPVLAGLHHQYVRI